MTPMPDTTLTSAELDELERRYTPEPVPPCPVCGGVLCIQSAGGGNATVYGCEPKPFDREHYERSRWTQFRPGDRDVIRLISLARSGLEARKAEESMRERAATVADDMRDKFGSPTGDAYSNGLWDQGVRIATAIRALPLTGVDKP